MFDARAVLVGITSLSRLTRLALLAVLPVLAGCAGSSSTTIGTNDRTYVPDNDTSIYGNYLAGRYAGAVREVDKAAEFFRRALEQDPDSAIILERAFLLEVADGDIERAVELADRIVARDAGNRIARLVLALSAFKSKNYELVRTHLSQGRSGPLNAIVSDIVTAWSYAAQGNEQQAFAALEKGANSSLSVFYVSARGHIRDYLGYTTLAEADYAQAHRLTDGHALNTVLSYASNLARQGKTAQAATVYQDYLALAPGHAVVTPALERLEGGAAIEPFVASPDRGVALAIYNPASYLAQERAVDLPIAYLHLAIYIDPTLDSANILLADLYEKSNCWANAMQAYAQVPRDSDYYRSAQIQYAVNLDRLDRTDEAVRLLRSMVDGSSTDIDVLSMLGDMQRFREQFGEAIEAYTKAIDLIDVPREEDWGLYYARGVALERSNRWPEAERDFLTALDLSPNQPLVLNYLGYSWIEKGLNLDRALELIQLAVSMRPDDGFIVDSLGWAYYKLGEYETAVRYLERAVELQPNDPTINEHLGDAYWKVGRKNEARFQWNHALDLDPNEDLISSIQRKLDYGTDYGTDSN